MNYGGAGDGALARTGASLKIPVGRLRCVLDVDDLLEAAQARLVGLAAVFVGFNAQGIANIAWAFAAARRFAPSVPIDVVVVGVVVVRVRLAGTY